MKISIDFRLVYRDISSSTTNQKINHGFLSLGLKDDKPFLLLQTASQRSGNKYELIHLTKIFIKFLHEGKCTLRFSEPPIDICLLKCKDISELKQFLQSLASLIKGENYDVLNPNIEKVFKDNKRKLVITEKSKYPFSTGFPKTLTILRINNINLKRFDSRILRLDALGILDYSHNSLEELPKNWDKMTSLTELHLSSNSLRVFPFQICQNTHLSVSLKYLDLSHNTLKSLPFNFCNLRSLITLKINNNSLESLPLSLGKIRLKYFNGANNQLTILPGSLHLWRTESCDISGNPFTKLSLPVPKTLQVSSLFSLCGLSVLSSQGIPKLGDIPMTIYNYLNFSSDICFCGKNTLPPCHRAIFPFDMRRISIQRSGNTATMEANFCSLVCLNKYFGNPHAS